MKRNRRNAKLTFQSYNELYQRLDNVPFDTCWYCGDPRTCLDHSPPLAMLDFMDLDLFRKLGREFCLIPCCDSCHSLLGIKELVTPNERLSWLLGAYHKLFDKAFYGWTEEEVAEMGYNFRVMINSSKARASTYAEKVRYIEKKIVSLHEWK